MSIDIETLVDEVIANGPAAAPAPPRYVSPSVELDASSRERIDAIVSGARW